MFARTCRYNRPIGKTRRALRAGLSPHILSQCTVPAHWPPARTARGASRPGFRPGCPGSAAGSSLRRAPPLRPIGDQMASRRKGCLADDCRRRPGSSSQRGARAGASKNRLGAQAMRSRRPPRPGPRSQVLAYFASRVDSPYTDILARPQAGDRRRICSRDSGAGLGVAPVEPPNLVAA